MYSSLPPANYDYDGGANASHQALCVVICVNNFCVTSFLHTSLSLSGLFSKVVSYLRMISIAPATDVDSSRLHPCVSVWKKVQAMVYHRSPSKDKFHSQNGPTNPPESHSLRRKTAPPSFEELPYSTVKRDDRSIVQTYDACLSPPLTTALSALIAAIYSVRPWILFRPKLFAGTDLPRTVVD